jgi:hypothetical protein
MTLEDVKAEFQLWRTKKANKSEKIPDDLWRKVHVIHQNYQPTKICQTLSLGGQQLKNKIAELSASAFIEIPVKPSIPTNNDICQIKLTHGNKVLSLELAIKHMDRIIPSIGKLMQ